MKATGRQENEGPAPNYQIHSFEVFLLDRIAQTAHFLIECCGIAYLLKQFQRAQIRQWKNSLFPSSLPMVFSSLTSGQRYYSWSPNERWVRLTTGGTSLLFSFINVHVFWSSTVQDPAFVLVNPFEPEKAAIRAGKIMIELIRENIANGNKFSF